MSPSGDLAAFAGARGHRRGACGWCYGRALGNGREKTLAVAKRHHTKLSQIRLRERAEEGKIDIVLDEAGRVLPEPEGFRPPRDVHPTTLMRFYLSDQ